MSACEQCWAEASRKAFMGGGHTAELYRFELANHPEHASPIAADPAHSTLGDHTREEQDR